MKYASERETLPGYLRDLDIRLTRQERRAFSGGGGGTGGAQGPQGPPGPPGVPGVPGPTSISNNPNNAARLGTDGLIYIREVMVKSTPPTPEDFGGQIPVGAIWVEI